MERRVSAAAVPAPGGHPGGEKVTCWWLDSSVVVPGRAAADAAVLGEDEMDRAGRLRHPEARAAYVAGHALVRRVLGEATRTPPAALRFGRVCRRCGDPHHGKPFLADPDRPIDFSLSHSGPLVVVAVGPPPVGADVEAVARRRSFDPALARRTCSPAEVEWLSGLAEDERKEAFLGLWSAKEAAMKAVGAGVVLDARTVEVLPAGERPWDPAVVAVDGREVQVVSLSMPGGRAAVAAPPGTPVVFREAGA